jgi:hypothetical protein
MKDKKGFWQERERNKTLLKRNKIQDTIKDIAIESHDIADE